MPKMLAANWKMNLPPEGVGAWMKNVGAADAKGVSIVVAPPFPYLRAAAEFLGSSEFLGVPRSGSLSAPPRNSEEPEELRGTEEELRGTALQIAAQNCSDRVSGAFTGEVSPAMIADCGATHVILGHSERRSLFGESDAFIARKLALVIESGLRPILCIGEDKSGREAGRVAEVLTAQLKATAVLELQKARGVVIAYEPVWAIGTGLNASGAMVAETLIEIRRALAEFWPAHLASLPILYGGSVTPDNVGDLVANGTIDGFLVGGASLDSAKFLAILRGLTAEAV